MLEQHELDHLLAVGEQQRNELMGMLSGAARGRVRSAARITGSDPVDDGANPSRGSSDPEEIGSTPVSPTISQCACDIGIPCPPNWRSCKNYRGGFPSGLGAGL